MASRTKNLTRQKNTGTANSIQDDKILSSPNAIKREKQRLSALFDSIQDEVWFADKDRKLIQVNRAVVEEFGPSVGEDEDGEKVAAAFEVFRPDGAVRPVEEAPPLRALRGEIVRNQEEIVRTPATGELRHRQVSAAPVKDADGCIVGSISIVRDITDQKQAEIRLKNDLNALTQIHKLSERLLDGSGLQPLLKEILDAAIEIVKAEKGTLQLLEGNSLRIVAHLGHQQPFLDFFESAENRASVCGEATRRGERVIVPDIETSSLFADTASLSVLRNAGVRAVQSTPISSRTGALLGILTTQWIVPHTPGEHDLWRLDLLVRQAADLIEHAKSKEALRESEARFRSYFELGLIGMAIASPTKGIIEVNDELCRILGYGRDELLQRTWAELTHADDLTADVIEFNRVIAGEIDGYSLNKRFICKDGRIIAATISVKCLRRADGSVDYFVALVQDITERKRAEDELQESQTKLKAAFASMTEAIFIADADGRLTDFNDEFVRYHRFKDKAECSKRIAECPIYLDAFFPDGTPAPLEMWAMPRALRGETGSNVEYLLRKKNTGESWWGSYSYGPIKDENGGIAGAIVAVREITDRKRAEEQLIRNQKTFTELVERAPFGIYVVDSQFRIAEMNAGSQNDAFRNVRPLIGRDFSEAMRILWPESVAAGIIGHFRHTLETGEPYYSPRFTNPRHDIEIIESYEWELHRIALPDGQYGVICYYFDSTELRNAELALKEANATLEKRVEERTLELAQRAAQLRALTGELTLAEQRERSRLANILHDHLQQMLVAAKFRLTVLGRGVDDVVKQAINEVEELIDESIVASRSLTAELSPPILHEAGLKEGLQWLARRMADTQGLFVDLELNESGPLPDDLKILLFQSVRELLFNVVKHANTRSAAINLRRLDESLQVTVSDQGTGFDPAAMPLAGEGGRGFGLLSIQERLKYMGGTLGIESNPGQGSRFVLSVPVVPAATIEPILQETLALPEAHSMAPQSHDPGRKIRVMLADDHAIFRQGIANLLTEEPDIEVIGEAADGQEAIDLAAKILPDVILMDMSMPKLNGVEATRIIHNDWPEIRIIGLSMFEEEERSRAIRDAGAVDYVTKSGPVKALINVIRANSGASNKVLSAKIPS
jgi:PAS domain S-box-containing protein